MFKTVALSFVLSLSGSRALATEEVLAVQERPVEVLETGCDASYPPAASGEPCKTITGVFVNCASTTDVCVQKNDFFAQCRPASEALPSSWNNAKVVQCVSVHSRKLTADRNKRRPRGGEKGGRKGSSKKSRGGEGSHEGHDHEGHDHGDDGKKKKGRGSSKKGKRGGDDKHDHSKDHKKKGKGGKGHDHSKDHAPGEGTNCPKSDMAKGCACAGKLWRCADKHDPIAKSCDVGLKCVRKNKFYAICATPEREAAVAGDPAWEGKRLPCGVHVGEF